MIAVAFCYYRFVLNDNVKSDKVRPQKRWRKMECLRCGSENLDDAKFCWDCGAELKHKCPTCSKEVLPDKRYCPYCGTLLKKVSTEVEKNNEIIEPESVEKPALVEKHEENADEKEQSNLDVSENEEENLEIPEKVSFDTVIDGVGFKFATWKSYVSLPLSILFSLFNPLIKGLMFCSSGFFLGYYEYEDMSSLDLLAGFYLFFDFCYLIPLCTTLGLKSFKNKAYNALIAFYWMAIIYNLIMLLFVLFSDYSRDFLKWGNSTIYNVSVILVCTLEMIYFKKRDRFYNRVDVVVELLGRNF